MRRFLYALLLALLLPSFALAQLGPGNGLNPVGPAPGQVTGTNTNDSAVAGNIGELKTVIVGGTTATVTVTIATPGVVSWTAHGLTCATAVYFTTTGALPTGLTSRAPVYVTCGATLLTNTFQVSSTVDNAIAGTSIATSGTQSGVQTGQAGLAATTNTTQDIAGLSLTAGQWLCYGSVVLAPAGTTTVSRVLGDIAAVSATQNNNEAQLNATLTTGATQVLTVPSVAYQLASTSTRYLITNNVFATSTMDVRGQMECARTR